MKAANLQHVIETVTSQPRCSIYMCSPTSTTLAVSTAYVIPKGRQEAMEKLVMGGHACNNFRHAIISKTLFAISYKAPRRHAHDETV